MKLVRIDYDKDEDLDAVTVKMSSREVVALVNIAGKLNGHARNKLGLEAGDSLYDCLTDVINKHYEYGVPSLNINSLDDLNKSETD